MNNLVFQLSTLERTIINVWKWHENSNFFLKYIVLLHIQSIADYSRLVYAVKLYLAFEMIERIDFVLFLTLLFMPMIHIKKDVTDPPHFYTGRKTTKLESKRVVLYGWHTLPVCQRCHSFQPIKEHCVLLFSVCCFQ